MPKIIDKLGRDVFGIVQLGYSNHEEALTNENLRKDVDILGDCVEKLVPFTCGSVKLLDTKIDNVAALSVINFIMTGLIVIGLRCEHDVKNSGSKNS